MLISRQPHRGGARDPQAAFRCNYVSAPDGHSAPKGRSFKPAAHSVRSSASFFSTTAAERKVMLACGGAAGPGRDVQCSPPLAVFFGLELLLFEFRARSFIPLVIASAMAVGIRRLLFGAGPMFLVGAPDYNFLPNLPST